MEGDSVKLFVVLEEHMIQRYSYIINEYGFKSFNLRNFGNVQLGISLKSIFYRIKHRKLLGKAYEELKSWINDQKQDSAVSQLYLSNSEGYIAHNVILKLKRDFPSLELIGLQHGVFSLSKPRIKILRLILNRICYVTFGFLPFGAGFGKKIVDKYMVYNQVYKDYLIDEFDWAEENVIIGWEVLKSELFSKKRKHIKNGRIALFLMQCLSKASLCNEEQEKRLNTKTISYLSKNFDEVLVKNHPACSEEKKLTLNGNVKEVEDLIDAFNSSTHAFSYASTTLLEAEIFELKVTAIKSKLIKDRGNIYKLFNNVLDFDNEIDI